MKINLHKIKIKDIVKNYQDNEEEGVVAYDGKLNVRPPYQREFVYKDRQRNSVIDTVFKNFPLNVMYWVKLDNQQYEILDGQQRTLSICQYYNSDFSIDYKYFSNLTQDMKNSFLEYELMIYICEGTDSEKLDWFKIVNIAGEKLTDQELRNSVYTGLWLTDAKRYFSKTRGPAYAVGEKYIKGSPNRQDYLETALKWISEGNIEEYMSKKQHSKNANELWLYYSNVINWIKTLFPDKNYRSFMKNQPWGELYNKYKSIDYDANEIEKTVSNLMLDDEVTKKSGIYQYIFDQNEKHLSLRAFSNNQKQQKYEEQKGLCIKCKKNFKLTEMEGDHITPWSRGGKTTLENLQMLCKNCNRKKSNS